MTEPIFIFSLPRSGSTLLQKIVGADADVATCSEPWLLLPLSAFAPDGPPLFSLHSSRTCRRALADLAAQMEGGEGGLEEVLRETALSLYGRLGRGRRYFLDKTPRYYLVLDFIDRLFPRAKKIFLFRSLPDVFASILGTFEGGRFRLHYWKADLVLGPALLAEGWERHGEGSLKVHYEDLVRSPREEAARVFDYLGLESDPAATERFFDTGLSGSLGDPKVEGTRAIHADSVDTWRGVVASPLRKAWMRRWIRSLGEPACRNFRLERETLLGELDLLHPPLKGLPPDLWHFTLSSLAAAASWKVLRAQASLFRERRALFWFD